MALIKDIMTVAIGGSVGLLVAASLIPQADTTIAGHTLNGTGSNALWQLLPLFIVVALIGALVAVAIKDFM